MQLLHELHNTLQRSALLTNCKAFVRPSLDYGDITHNHGCNTTYHEKFELE